ncbi:hypothetical protein E3P99_03059 [Wallemia hederae]|uniref:Xylanolytic transcriptional activator regulatory domain-containing protein n=1 Tax=Wallemia hederae TaxID=1540922 RepID=A0A4T0FHR1_9BASI|nr:hypothetical protein E3P99_03059 [Wallemia hederae]
MNTNMSATKKPKVNRACDACRRKKARDTQTYPDPCTNCKQGECTFEKPAPKKGVPQRYVKDLEARLERYEAAFGPLPPEYNSEGSPSSERSSSHKRKLESSSPQYDVSDSLTEKMNGLFVQNDDGPAPKDNGVENRRYFGKSSMKGIMKRITLHTDFTAGDLNNVKRSDYWREDYMTETIPSTNAPYTHQDFGDEGLMFELVDAYFDKVNVTLPILNRQRFIADIPKRKLERGFGSILIMICAIGSQRMPKGDKRVLVPGKEDLQFLAGYHFYLIAKEKFIDQISVVASLEDVQAMILLQTYVQNGLHPKSSWLAMGNAMLMAHDIGLNNKWSSPTDDKYEQEARSRAMWALFVLDTANSAGFGRLQLMSYNDINLDLPSAEKFGEFDEKSKMSVLYMNIMIRLYKLLQDILKSIYRLRDGTQEGYIVTYADIAAMNSQLNGWLNDLPEELRGEMSDKDDDDIFQMKGYMKIAFYTTQTYIYKLFLPDPSSQEFSAFRLTSLFICCNAARSVISISNKLLSERSNSKGLLRCEVVYSWSIFPACLVLILSFCESRKNGDFNGSDLEYIQTGITVLKKIETRQLIMGRALDMIMQIVLKAQIPLDPLFVPRQIDVTKNVNINQPNENLAHDQPSFTPAVDLPVDDLMNFDLGQYDLNGPGAGIDYLMPSLDSHEDDWSAVLSTVFDGSSSSDPMSTNNVGL